MQEKNPTPADVNETIASAEAFARSELERLAIETGEDPTEELLDALAQQVGENVAKMLKVN